MASAATTTWTPDVVRSRLDDLRDEKILAVNEKHGDDHAVNLTKLRALAKEIRSNHDLARELWQTGDTESRLVALLICRPKEFSEAELDAMLREAKIPKVHGWLVDYVVKKSAHLEPLRALWMADRDPVVQSAGWALTAFRVAKGQAGAAPAARSNGNREVPALDLPVLLDDIESRMQEAPERLQWAMNQCLAEIGIQTPKLRERAIAIGEKLEVLKDYPTPPGCTSPFAPIWITEIVRRNEER